MTDWNDFNQQLIAARFNRLERIEACYQETRSVAACAATVENLHAMLRRKLQ